MTKYQTIPQLAKLSGNRSMNYVGNALTYIKTLEGKNNVLAQEFKGLLTSGAQSWWGSTKGTVSESLKGLVEKGFAGIWGSVIGKSGKEYLDNVLGQWVDDQVKALVKNYIDFGKITTGDLRQPASQATEKPADFYLISAGFI